ncbi:MAG TPA: hypothetical protein VMF89_32070, partial [Polyangiales bacterium]|nr:hypothetical protein [Polyangiales bacterium]
TIALPAAKLWLVGPHVRYYWRDVRLFQIATIVGFMLTVVLCLGFAAREALRAKMVTRLEGIAVKLGKDVAERIATSAQALNEFAQVAQPFVSAAAGTQPSTICQPLQASPASMKIFPKDWNVVFRLDAQGRQVAKNYHSTATPCVSVPERSYFRAVQSGRLRDMRTLGIANAKGGSRGSLQGAAEIVRSRTTGKTTLIVAMPDPKQAGATLALERSLEQLTTQLLPRAIQTAVIDPRGRVMLHSDNASFQEQSLFDDVDGSDLPALRAAIEARYRGPVAVEYLGAPNIAYLYPLQAGWTALSFAPSALLDLPTRQVVFLTLLLCLACLFLLLCLALPVLFERLFDAEARGHAEDVSLLPEQAPAGRLTYYGLPQTPLQVEETSPELAAPVQASESRPPAKARLSAL